MFFVKKTKKLMIFLWKLAYNYLFTYYINRWIIVEKEGKKMAARRRCYTDCQIHTHNNVTKIVFFISQLRNV